MSAITVTSFPSSGQRAGAGRQAPAADERVESVAGEQSAADGRRIAELEARLQLSEHNFAQLSRMYTNQSARLKRLKLELKSKAERKRRSDC